MSTPTRSAGSTPSSGATVLAIALALAVAATTWYAFAEHTKEGERAEISEVALGELNAAERASSQALVEVRDYLLLHLAEDSARARQSQRGLRDHAARLRVLTTDSARLVSIGRLNTSLAALVAFRERLLTAQAGEATALLQSRVRRELTENVARELAAIRKSLRDELTRGRLESRRVELVAFAAIIVELVGAMSLMFWALARLREGARRTRASEERLHSVLSTMLEGVVLQDASLAIRIWNPAAERLLGMSGDQLLGKTSLDPAWRAMDEDGQDLPGERHPASTALRTGTAVESVMGVQRGDGDRVWLRVRAVPTSGVRVEGDAGVVVTFSDVTAERVAVEALRRSESRYRAVADSMQDVVIVRSPSGAIEYASPSMEQVLGWTAAELLGTDTIDLVHPDDRGMLIAGPRSELLDGRPVATMPYRALHKAGHVVWLETRAAPMFDEQGRLQGVSTVSRDVTERRRLEEELRHGQKMQAMGRMASAIAHDFNNLLAVVRLATDAIVPVTSRASATEGEEARLLVEAVDRASTLTAQLLAFARRTPVEPRLIVIPDVVRGMSRLIDRLIRADVTREITVDPVSERRTVLIDPSQVEQTLVNLIVNANDAVEGAGHVIIACAVASLATPMPHRHGVVPAGDFVTLTVSDSGTGIPPAVMEHLFEPFFTTKPMGRGTGLGLSTVFGIAVQAGGSVRVTSTEGAGASFTVYLPARPRELTASEPATDIAMAAMPPSVTEPVAAVPLAVATLMFVDDEPAVRLLGASLLERAGYHVLTAASAPEALGLIDQHRSNIRAIITDVRMPGMDGSQMVERMRQQGIRLPVIFISGQIDSPVPFQEADGALVRFLGKPFSARQLLALVQEILEAA